MVAPGRDAQAPGRGAGSDREAGLLQDAGLHQGSDPRHGATLDHEAGQRARSRLARAAYAVLGGMCVVVGVAGLVLPLVPGTVFLILAAACFARSSPRLEAWLLAHPRLGPPIAAWRAGGAIPRRAKAFILATMALSFGLLCLVGPLVAIVASAVAMPLVALYILTRPNG